MYRCEKCEKEFDNRFAYIGHMSSHNRGDSYKEGRKKESSRRTKATADKVCKYCNAKFENGWKLGGHQSRCEKNPNAKKLTDHLSEIATNRKMSKTTKDKISVSMKKYFDENPGMIPYLVYHSSKESYPEKVFREALQRNDIIGWTYNYPLLRYALDFAFVDKKIDVEIDGSTHNDTNVSVKDKIRNERLMELGWKVIRFSAKDVKSDVQRLIDILKEELKCDGLVAQR